MITQNDGIYITAKDLSDEQFIKVLANINYLNGYTLDNNQDAKPASIPIFDRNQAGVQEARARRNSTESRLTAAIRNVAREVDTAYASFQNADKVLGLYRSNIIPQLDENLKLTQEAYRLGEVGILSVIQEQKKFFEVNDGYLTALHGRQTALVKLESAVATELSGGVQ